MKFDFVIGNPPYQLEDNGHFYRLFINKAKTLANTVAMVIPCSYFNDMSNFIEITHYKYNGKNFKNVDLATSWFIWRKDNDKPCKVVFPNNQCAMIDEFKLPPTTDPTMFKFINDLLIMNLPTYKIMRGNLLRKDAKSASSQNGIACIWSCGGKKELDWSWIDQSQSELVSGLGEHKVVFSEAYGGSLKRFGHLYPVLGDVKYAPPEFACAAGARWIGVDNKKQAKNLISYLKSDFCTAIVGNVKTTFHNTQQVFNAIPKIDLDVDFTNEYVYSLFSLPETTINIVKTYGC